MKQPDKRNTFSLDPEAMFPKVEKMIWKLAWRAHQTHGIPLEDTYSESAWGFLQACRMYRPDAGTSPETFTYRIISYKLLALRLKEGEREKARVQMTEEQLELVPLPQHEWSVDLLSGLSEDAQEIVQLLIESPAELLGGIPRNAKTLLNKALRYLKRLGRDTERLEMACDEIRLKLRECWE